MPRKDGPDPLIASNRKAYHDYFVLERFEAGIKLTGTEVKSCRARMVNMQDSFVNLVTTREARLQNLHISPYENGNRFNHEPKSARTLLLHRNEILKLFQQTKEKGLTVIPLKMYLNKGLVKVEIGLCKGKTHGDKRETMREKQDLMDAKRAVRNKEY